MSAEWRNRIVEQGVATAGELMPNPKNWRGHPAMQATALSKSLENVGWVSDVIVNRTTGHLVDGHLRVALALKRGAGTAVPVKYVELTPEEEMAVLVTLDPLAAMATTDEAMLLENVRSLDDTDLADMVADVARHLGLDEPGKALNDPGPQIDRAEELRQKWGVELGQLWQLGDHRLICGDCTDAAAMARVMGGDVGDLLLSDPPYNVGIEYGAGTNDRKTLEQNETFIQRWFEAFKDIPVKVITPGVGYGMNTLRSWLTLFPPRWMCIWLRKNGTSRMPLRGFQQWEPILFYEREDDDQDAEWGGVMVYGKPSRRVMHDVFDIPVGSGNTDVKDDDGKKLHPVPKPLLLFEVLLRAFSDMGQIVVDGFLGSGTTLIACEKTGRRFRGSELEPAYVAVALERWATMTGREPVLL